MPVAAGQTLIPFPDQPLVMHSRENNPESQQMLKENKPRFHRQAIKLFNLLMQREHVSGLDCAERFGIVDLRARTRDFRENKIHYSKKKLAGGLLDIWMSEEDIAYNKIHFKHFLT